MVISRIVRNRYTLLQMERVRRMSPDVKQIGQYDAEQMGELCG